MSLERSRLYMSRLPFLNRLTFGFSKTARSSNEPCKDEIEGDFCELGESNSNKQNQTVVANETPFPFNSLPADVLVLVIEQLVVLYLTDPQPDPTVTELPQYQLEALGTPSKRRTRVFYPRKPCSDLHTILSLRLVNSIWTKEVLRALHNNLTLPDLPEPILARFIPSTSPSIPHRRTLFASALYNSTLSISNRRLGITLPKRILSCADYALSIRPRPPFTKKETVKRLCTAASQKTTYGRVRSLAAISRFPSAKLHCYPGPLNAGNYVSHLIDGTVQVQRNPVDELAASYTCTLVILGMEDRAIELLDAAAIVCFSDTFGRVDRVARNWGRERVAEWFEQEGNAEKITWDADAEWLDYGAQPYRGETDTPAEAAEEMRIDVCRMSPCWDEERVEAAIIRGNHRMLEEIEASPSRGR